MTPDSAPPPEQWPKSLEVMVAAIATAITTLAGLLGAQKWRTKQPPRTPHEQHENQQQRYDERRLAHDAHMQVAVIERKLCALEIHFEQRLNEIDEKLVQILKSQIDILKK